MSAAAAGYEVVIGLEIHAQLATRSKIFSGASTAYGAGGGRRWESSSDWSAGRPSPVGACSMEHVST